jgi:hypothetical protein
MAKYGKKAQSKVERAMHERKRGTLRSGGSGKKVTSRKQAIAIGLSEARRAGAKVPRKRGGSGKRSGGRKGSGSRKASGGRKRGGGRKRTGGRKRGGGSRS